MTRQFFIILVLLIILPLQDYGQAERIDSPIKTTLCEMYQHPEQYAGKMVEVHAAVGGNDLEINDWRQKTCSAFTEVIVVFPKHVKPAPGFDFLQDDSITKLIESLRRGKNVEATFEGRFDVAFVWRDQKKIVVGTDKGFGKKSQYGGRIVLRKVSDVVVHPGTRL